MASLEGVDAVQHQLSLRYNPKCTAEPNALVLLTGLRVRMALVVGTPAVRPSAPPACPYKWQRTSAPH